MQFNDFSLSKNIQKAVELKGYKNTTKIQEKVIPLVLEKKDIVVMAQTGSGKSASFILPLLEMWHKERDSAKKGKIKILLLTPTRELTLQLATLFKEFSIYLAKKPQIVSLIGGKKIGEQLFDIQQGCDILVATTGRFLDVLKKKQMNLMHLKYLILDEADKMLSLNFIEELDLVLDSLPKERQNLLFSATYPQKMLEIVSKIMTNPIEIKLKEEIVVGSVAQRVIMVESIQRAPLLRKLLKENSWKLVLVFMAYKRATDNIAQKFRKYGFSAASFNGDLDQELRDETLDAFKKGKVNILFATDIAARGLDIEQIESVINYDLPRSPTDIFIGLEELQELEKQVLLSLL